MTDHEIYADLLAGRHERLIDIARTLASLLTREGSAWVAGDAAEGYNPTHDVCRLVINAAVAIAARRGVSIPNLEFPLDAPPDDGRVGGGTAGVADSQEVDVSARLSDCC